MKRYSSPVLSAVAYPPTMLFAPLELAGMNAGLNSALMLIGTAALGLPPFVWLFTAIAGHIALITWGSRDPHLVGILRAAGTARRRSKNIVPAQGVKYVP